MFTMFFAAIAAVCSVFGVPTQECLANLRGTSSGWDAVFSQVARAPESAAGPLQQVAAPELGSLEAFACVLGPYSAPHLETENATANPDYAAAFERMLREVAESDTRHVTEDFDVAAALEKMAREAGNRNYDLADFGRKRDSLSPWRPGWCGTGCWSPYRPGNWYRGLHPRFPLCPIMRIH